MTTRPARFLLGSPARLGALAMLGASLAGSACAPAPANATLQVIPAPAVVERRYGSFRLAPDAVIRADGAESQQIGRYLSDWLEYARGIQTKVAQANGDIRLELRPEPGAAPESYTLEVSPAGIKIQAADARGLFYGAVTLLQLASADFERGTVDIPAMRIEDAPRFPWRGLMLDSARHYQPPAFIKKLIDAMAMHKLNVLHWHLTDDQGWRLEIKKYPALTAIGSERMTAGANSRPYGGYYTQEEVRDIVAYAAARFVTIVPEIEMPGHAQAAIASYPALGTGGPAPRVSPDWGVHDYLFNADESTLKFLEDVLTEVMELFPGQYIHVGGDEAVKTRWKASPRIQARIRELGLSDEEALQGWFAARIGRFLESRGRRLIGWDEILEGGVPAGAAVMSWRGTDGAVTAVKAGHDVVMAPSPVLYLDHWQSDSPREPPGRPGIVTLQDVYEFEPVPAALSPAEAAHILGAQVNAWTEHMRLPERVEHQVFPRAAALAEVLWSPASARDWSGFQSRMAIQFYRYFTLGIHYADSAFVPRMHLAAGGSPGTYRVSLDKQAEVGQIAYEFLQNGALKDLHPYRGPFDAKPGDGLGVATMLGEDVFVQPWTVHFGKNDLSRRSSEELESCSGKLVLRLEDDAPVEGGRAFFNVDIIDPCWRWPDADLTRGATVTASVGQLPFNFQIGKDADAIRRGDARTREGELEVRTGDCSGEPVVIIPLATAAKSPALTTLGPVRIPPQPAGKGLCLRFARPSIDPIWAVQWVELGD